MSDKEFKEIIKDSIDEKLDISDSLDPNLLDKYNTIVELVRANYKQMNGEISFKWIHEQTSYNYDVINALLTQALMRKDLIGFINDMLTDDLGDDILYIREKRLVDDEEYQFDIEDV